MYEVTRNYRMLSDGTEIRTWTREVSCINSILVEAGTNGYCGGDTGHGGRTYLKIEDLSSTDIRVHPLNEDHRRGFEVILGGDSELHTIIEALKFVVSVLEDESKKNCL